MSGRVNQWACKLRSAWLTHRADDGPAQLARALDEIRSDIPVLLISYNNGVYVEHMVRQLNGLGIRPIVLDNHSNDTGTRELLSRLERAGDAKIVHLTRNFGHKVVFLPPFYDLLPETFACSDPDLLFNENMPVDFLAQLLNLARTYGVFKAGLALELLPELEVIEASYGKFKCRPFPFQRRYSVQDWENRFWRKQLLHSSLEVFSAPIDTTMAVYDKQLYDGDFFDAVRVAGNFSCLHLPWYPRLDHFDAGSKKSYLHGNRSTSWMKT